MILEEGIRPYPRCPQCKMFVPQKSLNSRYMTTALCIRVMDMKWRLLAEEEAREGMERSLTAYGFPLFQFTSF